MFEMIKPGIRVLSLLIAVSLFVTGCANLQNAESSPASAPATSAPTEAAVAEATEAPAAEAAVTPTEAPQAESGNGDSQAVDESRTFAIDPAQSQARFTIFEELRGAPKTVEGVTTVEGSVTLNPANLSTASIGEITIDARSFKTDSSMRDGAIRRFILGSNDDAYRYIIFTPGTITGLPASAAVGDTLNFEVSGDLKIYDTVKAVTFAMTVTASSETELVGSGSATVTRSDFGLTIPSVPGVANVADEVPLFIDFVAKTQ